MHVKANHMSIETFSCDKKFVLKWRLTKHQENNRKPCPYEEIGCMFDHSLSEMCVFGKQCLNKLCPFRHDQENLETEVVEVTVEELKVKFDKLTEDEQYESKMVLCDKLCKASHGYHRSHLL